MAVRKEDLQVRPDARVIAFPTHTARARAAAARRRFILRRSVVAALVIAASSGLIWASASSDASAVSAPAAPATVVVQPGQTLWDVAERWAPADSDPRAYVDALIEANGAAVQAGQRISLPD